MLNMEMYKLLTFKYFGDERGKLVVIEGKQNIPFDIARAFHENLASSYTRIAS